MTGSEYRNIIETTLFLNDQINIFEGSKYVARAIFQNAGVAFPSGDYADIYTALCTNTYMNWRSCNFEVVQALANGGTPTIGVDCNQVIIILPMLSIVDSLPPSLDTKYSYCVKTTAEISSFDVCSMSFFAYETVGTTIVSYPYVDIPQDGNIGTVISYMGYHLTTDTTAPEYKLKQHAKANGRYAIANPMYYAVIDGRIVIATKANIGNIFPVQIGDYLNVTFQKDSGEVSTYYCIMGETKEAGAEDNVWGHYGGQGVVEVVYHDYSPPSGYNANTNNPWDKGRVTRITKVGCYGYFG